jgi:hypothetical protein
MDLPESLGGYAEESAIAERSVETLDLYIKAWYRSRDRDGDSEFMAGVRQGYGKMIASLMGVSYRKVKEALERGELR